MRLIRIKEVMSTTGLSRSSIYRHINEDRFPACVLLSDRAVAWVESEVQHWIAEVIGQRDDNVLYGYDMEDSL